MDNSINTWLLQTPKYTTFRINRLKEFEPTILKKELENQSQDLNTNVIPKFFLLKSDCLVIEQWPADISLKKSDIEVVVDTPCAAAVLRGSHVYAPGVLGLPTNCHLNDVVNIFGDLDGKCKRGLKTTYGGKKLLVGYGYLKMLRYQLFDNNAQARGLAVHTVLPASRLPVINETLYSKGEILLQNLPSIVCGWVVNAQPYEYILDMCAAPGNKTTHLAEMSDNKAFITAIDKSFVKVAKIEEKCKIQGVSCVNAYVFDSTKCYSGKETCNNAGPPFHSCSFDKVLLDAPCSGLGQRPQLVNKLTAKMIQSYQHIQRKLFTAAVEVLKIGGKLVYSTCTTTKEENEGIVAWVLQKFTCLQLTPAEPLLGGPGLPDRGLNDEQRVMVQRFGPEIDQLRKAEPLYRDTIGFFIATFIKIK